MHKFQDSPLTLAINININTNVIIIIIEIELEPGWHVNPSVLVVSQPFGIAWVKAILLMEMSSTPNIIIIIHEIQKHYDKRHHKLERHLPWMKKLSFFCS